MAIRFCVAAGLVLIAVVAGPIRLVEAAISYTSPGSIYTENFNGLPTNLPLNANIQTVYADGWADDTTTTASRISVPGWHLYHPLAPTTGTPPENGDNNHQRVRTSAGTQNTGAFYLFGAAPADADKSLGSIGATTLAPDDQNMFIGLQLINNTGQTLNRFTITYAGEQWRRGTTSTAETLTFDFSTSATDALWFQQSSSLFTAAPGLNFTSPNLTAGAVAGNTLAASGGGRVEGITDTVTNFSWAPGGELWLRWADPQREAGAQDDGLSIDDFSFTADDLGVGAPTDIISVQTGFASAGSTWSNGQPPSSGNTYRVQSSHTVTVDGPFAGDLLRGQAGSTINFNSGGNGADVRFLVIDSGAALTESVSGDFRLGDAFAGPQLGVLSLNQDLIFNLDSGSDFNLDLAASGTANLTFNTLGAGSDVTIKDVQGLTGQVRFNGSGDVLKFDRNQQFDEVVMNSSGDNVLRFEHIGQNGGGAVTFSQDGTIQHATTVTSTNSRLLQKSTLIANAAVTVDLTQTYALDERRLSISDNLQGAGNILVRGSSTDPTFNSGGEITTLNEFELGATPDPTGAIDVDSYSGVLTAEQFVNVELRNSLRAARIVVNADARVEMGHQVVGTAKAHQLGEVQVNDGGTFEVGFEQVNLSNNNGNTGNHVGHLELVTTNGRLGSFTMQDTVAAGAPTLVMQVNGVNANQYDTIAAQGPVALAGTLRILVNPPSSMVGNSGATTPVAPTPNPFYTPQLGQIIPLITSSSGSPAADFDDSGTVDGGDFTIFRNSFGPSSAGGDADGDGDTDGADFLTLQRQNGMSGGSGITGTFNSVVFVDNDDSDHHGDFDPPVGTPPVGPFPSDTSPPVLVNSAGVMASLGLRYEIQYTGSAVNLVVVAHPIVAVPEPSAAILASVAALGLVVWRRRQFAR